MSDITYGTSTISSTNSVQNGNGTITQIERLFTIRPRGSNTEDVGGGNRGSRAYIRILSTDPTTSLNRKTGVNEGLGGTSLSASGGPLDAALNGNNAYGGYANFFVTDVRCALDEKLQITETFGDGEVAYFFGRQPMFMNVSGYIFDSDDNSWFVEFLSMYGQALRGTELARNYELVKLVLPNMYVIGSFTHIDWGQNSQRDQDIQFSFQFLIKQLVPIAIRMPGVPTSSDSGLINFNAIPTFQTQAQINTVKSSFSALQSAIQNPFSTTSDIASSITGLGSGLSAGVSADASTYGVGSNSFGFTTDTTSGSSLGSALSSAGSTISGIFSSVSANLTGLRASLFSPIYGVLSSLTKLVKTAMGSVTSIFNALTSPVRDIIRAVSDISNQAIGIVNLVNGTIQGLTGQVTSIDNQVRIALGNLSNAAGVISSAPKTISQSLAELVNAGTLPITTGYLQNRPMASLSSSGTAPSKLALLNSGAKYSAQSGASL
jgi:hypothetical protein